MWFLFALMSAFFSSVRRTGDKKLSQKLNHFTIGWMVQLLSLPILLIVLILAGGWLNPFTLGLSFWLPIALMWVAFYPLNTFLYTNAIKEGELSKLLPLQSLGPIFALLLGWILLGQRPSIPMAIGIVTIVIGIYVLNLKGRYLHNPLGIFTNDKANRYTIISLLLIASVGVIDTIAIRASNPTYYSFMSTVGAVPMLFIMAATFKAKDNLKIRRNIKHLAASGTLTGSTYVAYTLALNTGPLAYVSAVRSTSILMGTIIAVVHLKETLSRPKVGALFLITTGSIIIGLV